ncbi:MAG: insulinase family protein [Bacteroidales bacterium]|nr:insulinase family protein [Bacteroidales bacterium]
MKKIVVTLMFALAMPLCMLAQEPLKVSTFYLDNGLKVIIAEEHSAPKIFGAVIVHAGSKNEDTAATGVAHYFEHIMFKGTDLIGTTDWDSERVYLDSISLMYDKLHATRDEKERHDVQLEINRLNILASKYAIANETDAILQQMGCTGLNAGTSYDQTVYYNTLPSNQLENWMMVYAERFRNPVYRLFQSELEAVYEERNMYANEMLYTFSRNIFTESFGDHPYSRDIIGLDEHLKNPQPSQMKAFYDKYYVARNMTLLLVGDLYTFDALEMAKRYFSQWNSGEQIVQPEYNLPRFEKQTIKEVKQTPVKAGLMIFPGVKANDPDELPLSVLSQIVSGGNGSLDELASEGKLMAAQLMSLSLQDAGSNVILYVPKIVGQKHAAAEELIWNCLDSVKAGHFSDKLLESIKMKYLLDRTASMESLEGIAMLLESLEMSGMTYSEWEKDNERLQLMTREDIMRVAQKYFDRNHCTIVRSSMGLPKKSAAVKPDWDHLDVQNQGQKSPFAQMIAERQVAPIEPQVIDFKKDLAITTAAKGYTMYTTENKKNDLFTLNINYHYGTLDNKDLEYALTYFNMLGANDMTLHEFEIELERLGGIMQLSCQEDYTCLKIIGFERNMEAIMALVAQKLKNPRHDEQQLKNLIQEAQASAKAAKKDASTWSSALAEYVEYGEMSSFLNHSTIKEMKKVTGEELTGYMAPMFERDGYITFVGRRSPESVAKILIDNGLVRDAKTTMPQRRRTPVEQKENKVLYASDKSFMKSDISFQAESDKFDLRDRATCLMFNEYFGGGMNSVVFQEIREFRSLGYHTYGLFKYDVLQRRKPYLYCYLGTQCDKTNDGIEAMLELMTKFPDRPEKFETSRDYLIATRNSQYVSFRQIPEQVRYWMEVERVQRDPRSEMTRQIETLQYSDLQKFHDKYIKDRPIVITISGNAKKYDLKALKQYGEVKEVKYKEMIKW